METCIQKTKLSKFTSILSLLILTSCGAVAPLVGPEKSGGIGSNKPKKATTCEAFASEINEKQESMWKDSSVNNYILTYKNGGSFFDSKVVYDYTNCEKDGLCLPKITSGSYYNTDVVEVDPASLKVEFNLEQCEMLKMSITRSGKRENAVTTEAGTFKSLCETVRISMGDLSGAYPNLEVTETETCTNIDPAYPMVLVKTESKSASLYERNISEKELQKRLRLKSSSYLQSIKKSQ